MAHRLRTVELDFLDEAPHRFVFEAVVPASKETVFAAISDDPSTWTWWPGHEGGGYETPPPHGVGSRREMHMGESQYRETILAWDELSFFNDPAATEIYTLSLPPRLC